MRKIKVLIVDDIIMNRLLLTEIVQSSGHDCDEAENGKEAIKKLEEDQFDIILMDIEMPVMNGLETVKYIREQFPEPKKNIPVFALTAHNPQMFFEDFAETGFNQLVTKPYSIQKISNLIEEFLENKEVR